MTKRTNFVDSIRITVDSVNLPEKIDDEIKIINYNPDNPSMTVRVKADYYNSFCQLSPKDIKLISDLTFLVERVKKWYRNFHNTITFPQVFKNIELESEDYDFPNASPSQLNAIKTALLSPISYVWGAPGTGKTQFVLSNCILRYVNRHKKVLVIAPTNNALEQSARGIIKVFKENGVPTDIMLRLGRATAKFQYEHPEICESTNLDKRLEELSAEIKELQEQIDRQKKYLDIINRKNKFELLQKQYSDTKLRIEKTNSEYGKETKLKEEIEKKLEEIKDRSNYNEMSIVRIKKEMRSVFFKAKCIFNDNSKFMKLKSLEDLYSKREIYSSDFEKYNELYEKCLERLNETKTLCDSLNREYNEKHTQLVALGADLFEVSYSIDDIPLKISEKLKEYESIEIISNFEDILKEKIADYIKLANLQQTEFKNKEIILCTVDYAIYNYKKFPQSIDNGVCHIFVDEAAYCPMIKAGVFFAYGVPVTLLGDHMQLPPICEMDETVIKNQEHDIFLWSQSSIYFPEVFLEDSSYQNMFLRYANNENVAQNSVSTAFLNETYRFGDNLAKILDKFVYHSGFAGLAERNLKITVIHSSRGGNTIEKRINDAEADSILKYVTKNQNQLTSCAVITPYRTQFKNLQNKLRKFNIDILTIHASQGREWNTVIMSVVDTYQKYFMDSTCKKSNGLKIINTAISRAKEHLILVCDYEYWKKLSNEQLLSNIALNYTEFIDDEQI